MQSFSPHESWESVRYLLLHIFDHMEIDRGSATGVQAVSNCNVEKLFWKILGESSCVKMQIFFLSIRPGSYTCHIQVARLCKCKKKSAWKMNLKFSCKWFKWNRFLYVMFDMPFSQNSWMQLQSLPSSVPYSFFPSLINTCHLTHLPPWPWQSNQEETMYAMVSASKLGVCSSPDQPELVLNEPVAE